MRDDHEPKSRHPLAQEAERFFKDRDSWARCDSGRMGGHSSTDRPPSYNHYSDQELVQKYLEQKELDRIWADDRR